MWLSIPADKKLEASAYAVEEAEAPEVVEFEAEGTSEYYPTKIFETLGVDASIQSSSGDHKAKAKNSYEPGGSYALTAVPGQIEPKSCQLTETPHLRKPLCLWCMHM